MVALTPTVRQLGCQRSSPHRNLASLLVAITIVAIGATGQVAAADARPVLVIHGGAGVIRANLTPEYEAGAREALKRALQKGRAELDAGKPALDAVIAAIVVLEDDPHFNAGKGAVFTHDGRNELDAAIMDGATRRAGSVAGVRTIRNPIVLARAVMEKSSHVMLVGGGAEAFAKSIGIALVEQSYLRTDHRWQQLQKALRDEQAG